jgi:hypothetical protein
VFCLEWESGSAVKSPFNVPRADSVAMRWGEEKEPRKFPWKILAFALLTLLALYFIPR